MKPIDSKDCPNPSATFDHNGGLVEDPLLPRMRDSCIQTRTADISPASRELWQTFVDTYFDGPDHSPIRDDPFF